MAKQRLFVDMDGVLAEFNNQISSPEELYEEGYFRNLKPQVNVVEAIKKIIADDKIDVYILSSYLGDSKYALEEKKDWLNQHLPQLPPAKRIFVPCGREKRDFVPDLQNTDFLLDDYTHNLLLWQPPARGIKLLNDINHTKGTWQHDRISYERDSDSLAKAIVEVMRDGKEIKDSPNRISEDRAEAQKDSGLESRIDEIKQEMRRKKNQKSPEAHKLKAYEHKNKGHE